MSPLPGLRPVAVSVSHGVAVGHKLTPLPGLLSMLQAKEITPIFRAEIRVRRTGHAARTRSEIKISAPKKTVISAEIALMTGLAPRRAIA